MKFLRFCLRKGSLLNTIILSISILFIKIDFNLSSIFKIFLSTLIDRYKFHYNFFNLQFSVVVVGGVFLLFVFSFKSAF